jgi:hypothetical protein
MRMTNKQKEKLADSVTERFEQARTDLVNEFIAQYPKSAVRNDAGEIVDYDLRPLIDALNEYFENEARYPIEPGML